MNNNTQHARASYTKCIILCALSIFRYQSISVRNLIDLYVYNTVRGTLCAFYPLCCLNRIIYVFIIIWHIVADRAFMSSFDVHNNNNNNIVIHAQYILQVGTYNTTL